MEDFVLTMNNITKSFSGNEVLHSVSFDLKAGEVHTLMGENGAGDREALWGGSGLF